MVATATTSGTLRVGEPLAANVFRQVWLDTVFECFKLDPQFEDTQILSPWPLVMNTKEWHRLATAAEHMHAETLAAETALLTRPDLLRRLGLPRKCRMALERAGETGASPGVARVMRFDFHPTTEGWRVSEVNCDVPGGWIEAGGFTANFAARSAGLRAADNPADALTDALAKVNGVVGLVHATGYLDDRQVMHYLQNALTARGAESMLLSPDLITWRDGMAFVDDVQLAVVYRFFPAEWLPNLDRKSGWRHFFHGAKTPQCNPAATLGVQSKRLPLVWDEFEMPTWKSMLPETREVRGLQPDAEWVLKAALGRVGEEVGIAGVTGEREMKKIVRWARRRPKRWIAQRRFEALALGSPDGPVYPCIGVFTVDGKACGAYARAAGRALVDGKSRDVALLLED